MKKPSASIIIAVRNGEKTIEKCLNSVLVQSFRDFEVIVIDDGSTDATPSLLSKYTSNPKVKILQAGGEGPSKARNAAIAHAQGEYIAYTDADCIVEHCWLEELLKGFDSRPAIHDSQLIAGVGGSQSSPADDTEFGKIAADTLGVMGFVSDYMKTGVDTAVISETPHNPSCNVMYRKSVLDKAGPFVTTLWPGEDVELDYRITRIGYKLLYNPKAVVYHYRPGTPKKFANMMYRYGSVQAILIKKYGIFRVIHLVPAALPPVLLVFLFALFKSPMPAVIAALTLSAASVVYVASKSKTGKAIQVAACALMAVGYWHAGFYKALLKKHG